MQRAPGDLNKLDEMMEQQGSSFDSLDKLMDETFGPAAPPQQEQQGPGFMEYGERFAKGAGEQFAQIGADYLGSAAKLAGVAQIAPEIERLQTERQTWQTRLDGVDDYLKTQPAGNRGGTAQMFGPHGNADPFQDAELAEWGRAKKLGRDGYAAEIQAKIAELDQQIESKKDDPAAQLGTNLLQFNGRDVLNTNLALLSSQFTGKSVEDEKAAIEARDAEAAESAGLARAERVGAGSMELANFLAGPGGAVIGGTARATTGLLGRFGARGFLAGTAGLGAGLYADSMLRHLDPDEALDAALLAPAYKVVGILGEKSARSFAKVLPRRLAQGGAMATEGALFEVIPEGWRSALEAAGIVEHDVAHHAGLLRAGIAYWTADTPEEKAQALEQLKDAGAQAAANVALMGAYGAAFPSERPHYRRQDPEHFARVKAESSAENVKKSEPLRPLYDRVAELGMEAKPDGTITRPGWEGFRAEVKDGKLEVTTPEGQTIRGEQAERWVRTEETRVLMSDLASRALLRVDGVREGADHGSYRIDRGADKGEIAIGRDGTLRIKRDGKQSWEPFNIPELRAPAEMLPVEAEFLGRFVDSMKRSVGAEEGLLLDQLRAYAELAPKGDPGRLEFFNAISRAETMQRAAQDPVRFVRELAKAVAGGTEGSLVQKLQRGGQELYFIDPKVKELTDAADAAVDLVTGNPRSEFEAFGRRAMEDVVGEHDWAKFKVGRDARRFRRKLDLEGRGKDDATDLAFWLEKTPNPYIKGDTLAKLEARLSPAAREVGAEMRKSYDELHKSMRSAPFSESFRYVENYIPHLWEGPKGAKVLFSAFSKQKKGNPHRKKRSIPTLFEGITEHGKTPRTTDAVELLQYYESLVRTVEANAQLVRDLVETKLDEQGTRLIMRAKDAPDDYVEIGHHPLIERTYARLVEKDGKPKAELATQTYKAHPHVVNLLRNWLFQSSGGPVSSTVRTLNGVSKQIQLSASFFHPWSLAESGFANGVIKASKPWTLYTSITDGLKLMDTPIAERAIKSGLHLGGSTDAQRSTLDKFLDNVVDVTDPIPGVAQVTKGAVKLKKAWDKVLWDKMHPAWKLLTWNKLVTENAKRYSKELDAGEISMRDIERQAAQFTNDAYGGQNWDLYFRTHPQALEAAHLAFLAPDWTLSNLKIAARGVSAALPFLKETRLSGGATTRAAARRYWVRMLALMSIGTSFAQWTLHQFFGNDETDEQLREQGRTAWGHDNPPEMEYGYIRVPWKDEDGAEIYAGVGKQAKETLRWVTHFWHNAGSKLAPWPRAVIKQLTGHDAGSGFPAEWLQLEPEEQTAERIRTLLKDTLVPFSAQGNNVLMTLPEKKGMTEFRGRELLSAHLGEWASNGEITELSLEELRDGIKNVLDAADRNTLDSYDIFRKAVSDARGRYYKRLFGALNDDDEDGVELATRALSRLSAFPNIIARSMQQRYERAVEKKQDVAEEGQFRERMLEAMRSIDMTVGDPIRQQLIELERRRYQMQGGR